MTAMESITLDRFKQFDEATFFRNLQQLASAKLLRFLRLIDQRACLELANYAINYVCRPEEALFSIRREKHKQGIRAQRLLKSKLRKAANRHRKLAATQTSTRSLTKVEEPISAGGFPPLEQLMDKEAERIVDMLEKCTQKYTEKRFGLNGNTLWLVLMQDFSAIWTTDNLAKAQQLTASDISYFVTAAKMIMAWSDERSYTDPELIYKSMRTFRSNPLNQLICKAIPDRLQERCRAVRNRPYLLGIGI